MSIGSRRTKDGSVTALVRMLAVFVCGLIAVPPATCVCHTADVVGCPDDHDGAPGEDDHSVPGCPALLCADRAPIAANTVQQTSCESYLAGETLPLDLPASTHFDQFRHSAC